MGDWIKIHMNAAWNIEDYESLKGTRNTIALWAALGGIYALANKYQHDNNSSAQTQTVCSWIKAGIKYGALPVSSIVGFYNIANNLGWGPGETIGAIAMYGGSLYTLLTWIFGTPGPKGHRTGNYFPPFDPMQRDCPSIIPQAIRELRRSDQQLQHTLLYGNTEAMGRSFLEAVYEARRQECALRQEDNIIQFLDLHPLSNDTDRAEQLEAYFTAFNFENTKQPLLLFVDGIELLGQTKTINGKQSTPKAITTLMRLMTEHPRVVLIALAPKPGNVDVQILQKIAADHRFALSASFSSADEAHKQNFVKLFLPKATNEQITKIIEENRGKSIQDFVKALRNARKLYAVDQFARIKAVDQEFSSPQQQEKAFQRAEQAIDHDSFGIPKKLEKNIEKEQMAQEQSRLEAELSLNREILAQDQARLAKLQAQAQALRKESLDQADSVLGDNKIARELKETEQAIALCQQGIDFRTKEIAEAQKNGVREHASEQAQDSASNELLRAALLKKRKLVSAKQEEMKRNKNTFQQKYEQVLKALQATSQGERKKVYKDFYNGLSEQEKLFLQEERAKSRAQFASRPHRDDVQSNVWYAQMHGQENKEFQALEQWFKEFPEKKAALILQKQAALKAAHNDAERKQAQTTYEESLAKLIAQGPIINFARNGGAPLPQHPPVVNNNGQAVAAPSSSSATSSSLASLSSASISSTVSSSNAIPARI
jgi:hypothetical protein